MKRFRIGMVAACPFPAAFASAGLIRELSLALKSTGHDVHVITYHLGDEQFPTDDVPLHRIPTVPGYNKRTSGIAFAKPFLDLLLAKTLMRACKDYRFDVIHAHNYEAPPAGYLARRKLNIPVVYHAHNTMVHELPTYFRSRILQTLGYRAGHYLDRQIPGRADHIITVSREQTDYLASIGISRSRMTLIPPSVSVDIFSHGDSGAMRRYLGLDDCPIVIYTGGLQPYQNCALLIDVLRYCIVEIPNIRMLILARSEPSWLQELAVAAGVADRVHFIQGQGLQFERDCLAAANVGIIPRLHCIGFPIKLLNYAAANIPVVCFDGLNKDFVNESEILVAPLGHPAEMAARIVRLIRDETLRNRITRAARERLVSQHNWEHAVREIAAIYERVISDVKTR